MRRAANIALEANLLKLRDRQSQNSLYAPEPRITGPFRRLGYLFQKIAHLPPINRKARPDVQAGPSTPNNNATDAPQSLKTGKKTDANEVSSA